MERIQRKATSWILSKSSKSNEERLTELKLLPLSHYFELHYLLMLISVLKGNYNIKIPIKLNINVENEVQDKTSKNCTGITLTKSIRWSICYAAINCSCKNCSLKFLEIFSWKSPEMYLSLKKLSNLSIHTQATTKTFWLQKWMRCPNIL